MPPPHYLPLNAQPHSSLILVLRALVSFGQRLKREEKTVELQGMFLTQSRSQSPRYPCPAEQETLFLWTRVKRTLGTRLVLT